MRKCPKCGYVVENDMAKFCRKCGTNLPIAASIDEVRPTVRKERRKNKKTAVSIIAGVCCVIVLVMYFAIGGKEDKELNEPIPFVEEKTGTKEIIIDKDVDVTGKANNIEYDKVETPESAARRYIENQIRISNEDYPQNIGNGLEITKIGIENGYLLYTIVCNRDSLRVELMSSDVSKAAIMDSWNSDRDSEVMFFLEKVVQAGFGLGYKYINENPEATCYVLFEKNELEELCRQEEE